MNCMKCGREIALGQVFCKECLADMAEYPIKPGTPVLLPAQPSTNSPRRERSPRKPRKPEEQINTLKKWLIGLTVSLLAVIWHLPLPFPFCLTSWTKQTTTRCPDRITALLTI